MQNLRCLRAAVANARDALADLAEQLIVDRPLRGGKALARHERAVVVIAEDRDDIAGLCVRHLRDVQHAHVHTDPPDNGNQLPAQIEACLSGQQAAQAVGVADGQDGDAGIMRRSVKPSVADIRPGRYGAHLRDHGMQRHHGPQADRALQLLRRRVAVGDDAGAHHVEREFRVQDRRAGIAAVPDLRPDADALHGAEHIHKTLVLQFCKRNVFLRPAVGDAEVHENTLNVQVRQRRSLLQLVQRQILDLALDIRAALQIRVMEDGKRAVLQKMHVQLRAEAALDGPAEGGEGVFGDDGLVVIAPVGVTVLLENLPLPVSLPAPQRQRKQQIERQKHDQDDADCQHSYRLLSCYILR